MTKDVNINEVFFGVELETVVAIETVDREQMRVGTYHHGIQVPFLPTGWTAESDSSIWSPPGKRGCEIVSPKLKGIEGLKEVITVTKILAEKGFSVNGSTGCHISCFWDRNNPSELLSKLISVTAYSEKALYAVTGTHSRENGHYCNGVQKFGNPKEAKKSMDISRYTLLNLTNLQCGCDRVEFRVFSGSVNGKKIASWIMICLGLIERAMTTKRLPSWEAKPAVGGWAKKGRGASECERLLGFLGWSDGYRRLKGKSFGWIANDDVITEAEVKNELRRLAKKYDAEA